METDHSLQRPYIWFWGKGAAERAIFGDGQKDLSNVCLNIHQHICGEKLHRQGKESSETSRENSQSSHMVWKRLHFHHLEGRGVLILGASGNTQKVIFTLLFFSKNVYNWYSTFLKYTRKIHQCYHL